MKLQLLITAAFTVMNISTLCAQSPTNETAESVRKQLQSYVATFNKREAKAVVAYWTADAVSVQEETGDRTEGHSALLAEFEQFYQDYPSAQISGTVEHVRSVGPDVAIAEGQITLVTATDEPTQSAFTAVLKKQGNQWLIASSHERDLPVPSTPYDGLKTIEWIVGTWQDQTEGASVFTTVRWSPNRTFLIRSYEATFEDGESASGTQIFGWDPLSKQIRTWTFHSDGSFGDGTVSKNGDDWMVKMNQVQSDGRLASGTSVITRVDDDTMEVQKIGESVDGEPLPASEPVTVVRVAKVSAVGKSTVKGDGR